MTRVPRQFAGNAAIITWSARESNVEQPFYDLLREHYTNVVLIQNSHLCACAWNEAIHLTITQSDGHSAPPNVLNQCPTEARSTICDRPNSGNARIWHRTIKTRQSVVYGVGCRYTNKWVCQTFIRFPAQPMFVFDNSLTNSIRQNDRLDVRGA